MAEDLPELREGDPYPGAGYFNALRRLVHRALKVGVEDGSGLTVSQGADGTVIGGSGGGGSAAWYISGSLGIDARSDGDVYAQNDTEQERPIRVHNEWYSDCPANRLVCVMAGKIINWDCVDVPPPPEA